MRICRYSAVDFLGFLSIMVCSLIAFYQVRMSRLYSSPLKQLRVALYSLLKGILRGLLLRLVQQWLSTRLYSKVSLAELLFKNIGLLIKVCKDSQFKVKIVVFTAILRFISIELGQVGQLFTVGLYLSRLQIYNLQIYSLQIYSLRICSLQICGLRIYGLRICDLNNGGDLVCILVYRGIVVYNLRVGCILANKVKSKAVWVYGTNLVEWVRYKASNYIKFRRSKEFLSFLELVQDFLFSLFCLVLFMYCVVQGLCNSNLFIPFNPYTLVI